MTLAPYSGSGAPGRTRTLDLPLRRRLLYPLSYWCPRDLRWRFTSGVGVNADTRSAGPTFGCRRERRLETWLWSGRRDSNSRHTAWKAVALPAELLPHAPVAEAWSGREDSNLRPPAPKAGALPDCATPRRPTARRLVAPRPTACSGRVTRPRGSPQYTRPPETPSTRTTMVRPSGQFGQRQLDPRSHLGGQVERLCCRAVVPPERRFVA